MNKKLSEYLLMIRNAGKTVDGMYHEYVFGSYDDEDLRGLLSCLIDYEGVVSEDKIIILDDYSVVLFNRLLEF